MADGTVLHMALCIVKVADAVGTVGTLAAIERAAAQQGGELRQGHAIHLTVHDVVDTLLAVGYLRSQAAVEPLDYLAQEDARLAEGVEEGRSGIAEQLLRKQVQHLVGQSGRRKHLVVAEVGNAVQHIGIVFSILHKTED